MSQTSENPKIYKFLAMSSVFLIGLAVGAVIWLALDAMGLSLRPSTSPDEPALPVIKESPPPTTPPTPIPRVSLPEGEIDELQARVAELEDELARSSVAMDDMERQLHGTPLSWPEPIPEHFQEDTFKERLTRSIDDCLLDIELIGFDCSEPPCFAIIRRPRVVHTDAAEWVQRLQTECPDWTEIYGTELQIATDTANCPNGRREGFAFMGPSWPGLAEAIESTPENLALRFKARKTTAHEAWQCSEAKPTEPEPVPETTPEEPPPL